MKIVFATTCKGRVQHLERTLPRNLADNPSATFVVLDYNSSDHLLEYLRASHGEAIASGQLVVYSYREPVLFRMAHAKNLAHRLAIREGADILVNLDADNFTGWNFADYVADRFQQPGIFLWSGIIQGQGKKLRGCSGRIAVTVKAFLRAGGYDEKYETYSPDDKDFNARLQRLGYLPVEIERRYLEAIPHGDGIRFEEYPQAQSLMDKYEHQLIETSDATVVNDGNVGCGLVCRNFAAEVIELGRLPA